MVDNFGDQKIFPNFIIGKRKEDRKQFVEFDLSNRQLGGERNKKKGEIMMMMMMMCSIFIIHVISIY